MWIRVKLDHRNMQVSAITINYHTPETRQLSVMSPVHICAIIQVLNSKWVFFEVSLNSLYYSFLIICAKDITNDEACFRCCSFLGEDWWSHYKARQKTYLKNTLLHCCNKWYVWFYAISNFWRMWSYSMTIWQHNVLASNERSYLY